MRVGKLELKRAVRDYHKLQTMVPIGILRSKKEYARAVGILDAIIDEIGEDETHPLAELADALSVFVEKYEDEHMPIRAVRPKAVLRYLVREHGLRQSDLSEIGSQGVVSEVLAGKRLLNARQIRRLARRFGVSPAVFI